DAPDTAALFEAGSRAEVPIAGIVAGQTIAGQVDRLAVTAREVLVIDYKTGRAPPSGPDRVPRAYLRQMAAYRALLRKIYPERRVGCALLWTEGPDLVVLDEEVLERWAPGQA
ncbi:MAG: PD-(D/E)XK nuclease family protein, partial [Geminicoccales bacterium]